MSESLKTLLHQQATSVAFKPPDLETIARAGRQRVRRRRALATLAAVAAVVLAGSSAALVLRGATGTSGPQPLPASPWPTGVVSWAVDSTIYVGPSKTIDVGHEVHAFVRTATGFVVMDETDAVYAVTTAGVTPIGQVNDTQPDNTDQQRLVVNSGGTLVGWVDESASPGSLTVRMYDAVYGSTRDIAGVDDPTDELLLFALDDHTAYWRTGRTDGVHEVDLETGSDRVIIGRTEVIPGDKIYSFEVYSAENDVLAFSPDDDRTFFAGPSIEDAIQLLDRSDYDQPPPGIAVGGEYISGHIDPVRLSPTGAWLSFGLFEAVLTGEHGPDQEEEFVTSDMESTPVVFDTATGGRITLVLPESALAWPTVWLDDTTLQVLAFEVDPQNVEVATAAWFYECSLPHGVCEVAVDLGPSVPQYLVLPDGRYYGSGP